MNLAIGVGLIMFLIGMGFVMFPIGGEFNRLVMSTLRAEILGQTANTDPLIEIFPLLVVLVETTLILL